MAFSTNGDLLVTASSDSTVRLWDLAIYTDPFKEICARVGQLDQVTWDSYAPGEQLPQVCS
jgi:WD40 repeat protein